MTEQEKKEFEETKLRLKIYMQKASFYEEQCFQLRKCMRAASDELWKKLREVGGI